MAPTPLTLAETASVVNARVSKGHWLVLIFPVQCPKGRHMVLNAKTNFESAIFEKPE